MKKVLTNIVLIFSSLLVALLIGEAVVRITMPSAGDRIRLYEYLDVLRGKFTRYDPTTGWIGIPNVDAPFTWPDAKCRVRQNRYGFRGTAYPLERSGRRRIVCLGDSFVWGFGVDEEALFTHLLEAGSSAEVVNLGVSGFGNDQMLLLWQKMGYRWQPDEVLLFITFVTDLMENVSDDSYDYPKPVFRKDGSGRWVLFPAPPLEKVKTVPQGEIRTAPSKRHPVTILIKYSDLFCLFAKALTKVDSVRGFLEQNGIVPVQKHGEKWEYDNYHLPVSAETRARWQQMEAIVRMLAEDLRARGIRLRLVIVPSVVQVYPRLWQRFIEERPYGTPMNFYPVLPNRFIRHMAAALNLEVIDLLPALQKAGERNPGLYFSFNRHWTKDGHRAVADQLRLDLGLR